MLCYVQYWWKRSLYNACSGDINKVFGKCSFDTNQKERFACCIWNKWCRPEKGSDSSQERPSWSAGISPWPWCDRPWDGQLFVCESACVCVCVCVCVCICDWLRTLPLPWCRNIIAEETPCVPHFTSVTKSMWQRSSWETNSRTTTLEAPPFTTEVHKFSKTFGTISKFSTQEASSMLRTLTY